MSNPFFTGPFAPMCDLFVSQQRAIGFTYDTQAKRLRRFDDFCKRYDVRNYEITEEIATTYCIRLPNEKDNTRRGRVQVMQIFAEFLVSQGYPSYIPLEKLKRVSAHTPYIFTRDEIKRLFERIDLLEPSNLTTSPLMLPLLFRVLYGCGLRISEALSLLKQDVNTDTGILYIKHGKNDRERIIPMSGSLLEMCRKFLLEVHSGTPTDMPLFYTKSRTPFCHSAIQQQFRNLLWDIGIPYQGKDVGPRIHDIRHTFICHNIHRWAEAGIPIHSKLPILSKYVGHATTNATQWYLRLTSEIYPDIRKICEHELGNFYGNIVGLAEERGDE